MSDESYLARLVLAVWVGIATIGAPDAAAAPVKLVTQAPVSLSPVAPGVVLVDPAAGRRCR
jgi:hypothetical protein